MGISKYNLLPDGSTVAKIGIGKIQDRRDHDRQTYKGWAIRFSFKEADGEVYRQRDGEGGEIEAPFFRAAWFIHRQKTYRSSVHRCIKDCC